jgi:hypothetical protein
VSEQAGHLGGGAGLIEKHEPVRLPHMWGWRIGVPMLASLTHAGASFLILSLSKDRWLAAFSKRQSSRINQHKIEAGVIFVLNASGSAAS